MVDKSFTGLPRFISEGILGNLVGSSPPTTSTVAIPDRISRGFELFVQSVGKAKNKYDESQIVNRELQTLQTNLSQPNISMVQMRDYLCRMMYCHMLDYDVSFGIIHAVKLAQQGAHIDKKTGYLACCLLMHRDHELILLLVNTIQKDLKSSNILDNLVGLSACSQLVPVEMIPSVLPLVLEKLRHSRELVRQKALMCLYQFQLLAPDLLEHNQNELLKMLFDKDPGVMAAAVNIAQNCIQRNPEKCLSFGETLVSLLKQVSSHKMATMFEYHTVPFPWLQIQIIRCLAKLASTHKSLSTSLVPLLKEILQKTGIKEPIAFAIMYECIQCITCISPPKPLLEAAAQHIQRFLLSNHPNLKFIGVKLLVSLVQVSPEYSVTYQQLIVQSLENPDLSVQKKMHKLLYEIANETNVTVVCARLLTQLPTSADKFWRSEVITLVMNLVERFDSDVQWQIETVFAILQCGNDVIKHSTVPRVMDVLDKKFIFNGADQRGQKVLVQKCVGILVGNKPAEAAIHIAVMVLGELCLFLKNMPDDKVISLFTRHLTNGSQAFSIQSSIVTALQNLVIKAVVMCDTMATKIQECMKTELPVVIKQRLSVILRVCKHGLTLSYHDNPDTTLTFLDDIVAEDLEQGGSLYTPPHLRGVTSVTEAVASVLHDTSKPEEASVVSRPRTESTTSSTKTTEESESGLRLPSVKRVWGKQGRIDASTKVTFEESSSSNASLTEEETRQRELAAALFGGFRESTDVARGQANDISGFLPHSVDTAGWRDRHSTVIGAKSSEKQTDNGNVCNSEALPHDKIDLEILPVVTDNLIPLPDQETNTKVEYPESQSIYNETKLFEDGAKSANESDNVDSVIDEIKVCALYDSKVENQNSRDTDLDDAISALLENSVTEQDDKPAGVQLNSDGFPSKQLLHGNENVFGTEDEKDLDSVTNVPDLTKTDEDSFDDTIYLDDNTDEEKDGLLSGCNTQGSIYSLES